jgi:hypothetical protein
VVIVIEAKVVYKSFPVDFCNNFGY